MSANLMSLARSGGKFLKLFGDRKMVKPLPYDAEVEWIQGNVDSVHNLCPFIHIDMYTGSSPLFYLEFVISDVLKPSNDMKVLSTSRGAVNVIGKSFRETGVKATNDRWRFINDYYEKNTFDMYNLDTGDFYAKKSNWTYDGAKGINIFGHSNLNTSYFSSCKFHYLKFRGRDGLLDIIPVRVGDVGYLYDRVSGQLFGKSGTGAFIVGPDKTI